MANKNRMRALAEWLAGRYGYDELSVVLVAVSFVLLLANIFLQSIIVSGIALALMVFVGWRALSSNREARENENGVFCEFLGPVRPWVSNPAAAMREARTYRHLKCPECGKRVRVPRGKGKIRVKCPQCGNKFEARS